MLEAGALEVDEKTMTEAIRFGHKELQAGIEIQKKLIADTKVSAQEVEEPAIISEVKKYLGKKLADVVFEAVNFFLKVYLKAYLLSFHLIRVLKKEIR